MPQTPVTASWIKSASPDVTSQVIQITVDGFTEEPVGLSPDAESYGFLGLDNTFIQVDVWALVGEVASLHAHAELRIPPKIVRPLPPSELVLTYIPFP